MTSTRLKSYVPVVPVPLPQLSDVTNPTKRRGRRVAERGDRVDAHPLAGHRAAEGLGADLSAQMAFEFMRRGAAVNADVSPTTTSIKTASSRCSLSSIPIGRSVIRNVLIDLAAAGDFATYRDRRAARASMAIAAFADPQRSPIAAELTGPYDEQCAVLYTRLLDLLPELVLQPERHIELWADEDRHLTASEEAIASGAITIEERTDLDLAVVSIDPKLPSCRGHRFAGESERGVHPMAINNATGCSESSRSPDSTTPTPTATSHGCSTERAHRCPGLTFGPSPTNSTNSTPRYVGRHRTIKPDPTTQDRNRIAPRPTRHPDVHREPSPLGAPSVEPVPTSPVGAQDIHFADHAHHPMMNAPALVPAPVA